ncbi:AmiS/UreI family transporter [Oceanidesulfovibrio marinus]|uniref:Transporter n=1 Tax=Oceanidesulfovibrio marinus TaxID=370038 RepID=A0A6P1ZFU6_9BACT|nr:AmiS/UreI family transporter [Oceanidesulfovibrio marinus]TVM33681.1 transporter [Oceanidesulfovibrio marinus]
MTTALLILISVMWLPVALLNLGKGEAKGTGVATGFVGLLVVIGALIQGTFYHDPFIAGLLFAHGVLYLCVSYALLVGLEDLRSVGNVSLTVCLISAIYMLLFYFGSPIMADGTQLIGKSNYLAMACLGYAVLTLEVFLAFYGKLSPKLLAMSLIIWVPVGLWVPAFWLMGTGTLPF